MRIIFTIRHCKRVAHYSKSQITIYLRQAYRLLVYFGGFSIEDFAWYLGYILFVELACMTGKEYGIVACHVRELDSDLCSRCALEHVFYDANIEEAVRIVKMYAEIEQGPLPEDDD
jgi:hypothetical protein